MASIRDELRTILAIEGLSAYLNGLRQAQQGTALTAKEMDALRGNLTGIGRLLIRATEALGLQAGQWTILAAAMYGARSIIGQIQQVVRESTQEFEKYNATLVRTSFLFSTMGGSPGMSSLQAFARERGATTGIGDEETLALLGRARQSGFGTARAGQLVPLLQDVQTSGLTSATNAFDIINKLIHEEGRGRGGLGAINEAATQLRLDPRFFTGGQEHDVQEIIRQLTIKVGGLSEVMGQTVSGTAAINQKLLADTMKRLGGFMEASLQPTLEFLNRSLLGLTRAYDVATNSESGFGKFLRFTEAATLYHPNPALALVHMLVAPFVRLQDQATLANQKDRNADHDSRKLDEIAANTLNMPSALALAIFGSASAFTRQATSFRNFQAAINARAT